MTDWPSTLPAPKNGTYRESPPETTIRTQMEQGPAKVRRRFTNGQRQISFGMVLTQEQTQTLDAFYESDTSGGSLSFNYTHPRTGAPVVGRFLKPPSYSAIDQFNYDATVELEILNGVLASVGSGGASVTTDNLPEGSTNLYYTAERTQDMLASFIQAGTNVTVTYNDVSNTLTIASTGGGSTIDDTDDVPEGATNLYYTAERVQDMLNTFLVAGSNITLTYNDGADSLTIAATSVNDPIMVDLTDEGATVVVATGIRTIRMPYAYTLSSVKLMCTTAPTGAAIIVNIKKNGTTIFSTKVQIDATGTTSVGSGTAHVLSTTSFAADDVVTFDVDQVGSTIAGAGLKVTLLGKYT